MDTKTLFGIVAWMTALYVLFTFVLINETGATRYLTERGYKDISIIGYDFFGCGRGDIIHTGFKAVKNGKVIRGTVCEGLIAGKYIREK